MFGNQRLTGKHVHPAYIYYEMQKTAAGGQDSKEKYYQKVYLHL